MNRRPILMGKMSPVLVPRTPPDGPLASYTPRYLECTFGGSFKFWEVRVEYLQNRGIFGVFSRWGKIGTLGTNTQLSHHASESAAISAADAAAGKKLRSSGYVEKIVGKNQPVTPVAHATAKKLTDAEREKLATLLEDLDEVASS